MYQFRRSKHAWHFVELGRRMCRNNSIQRRYVKEQNIFFDDKMKSNVYKLRSENDLHIKYIVKSSMYCENNII